MPEYIISAAGGNFTDTAAWDGGVVPPSATSSDIIGLSTSGALLFNNLGNRNIGSLDLTQYTSSIGFTGSTSTINVYGATFGLGPSTTWNGNVGSGTLDNQRLYLRGYGVGLTQTVITNGVPVKRVNVYFENTTTNMGPIAIYDILKLHENSRIWMHASSTPTNTGYIMCSATPSERGVIEIDPQNIGTAAINNTSIFDAPRLTANHKGYLLDIKVKGTGTRAFSFWEGNYPANYSSIPKESIFSVESGEFNFEIVLLIGTGTTFKYIGGTISTNRFSTNTRPKNVMVRSYTSTNSPDFATLTSKTYIDTPGVDWDLFNIQHTSPASVVKNNEVYFLNSFSAKNVVHDLITVTTFQSEITTKIFGTNSSIYLGNFLVSNPVMAQGGVFGNGWYYMSNNFEFGGGFTYSFKSFRVASSYLDAQNYYLTGANIDRRIIFASGSNAKFEFTENNAISLWNNFENIDVVGTNKLYELGGGTLTNTSGIETALPSGGTVSGGGETSYTFLS